MQEEVYKLYEKLKELSVEDIDWLIRNVVYEKQNILKIEDSQAIYLSQLLRTTSNIWRQAMEGRIFDKGYLQGYYNYK